MFNYYRAMKKKSSVPLSKKQLTRRKNQRPRIDELARNEEKINENHKQTEKQNNSDDE